MSILLDSNGWPVFGAGGAAIRAVSPPAPGGDTLATYDFLTTGPATFGMAFPEGAAPDSLKIGSLDTQVDIKNAHPDGSIKFAILSADIPSTGEYAITTAASAATGSWTPTWPTASVAFVISGTTYTATLPSLTTASPWLDGPVCKEYRAKVVPQTGGGTPHALLEVWFDIRSYASGGHRVDVQVWNMKDSASADRVVYDLTITVNGSSVFTQSGVTHFYMKGFRKKFFTGGLSALATYTPDLEQFFLAGALPRYAPDIANKTWTLTGAGFGILNPSHDGSNMNGLALGYMGDGGGSESISLYPEWVAKYCVYKTQNQFDAICLMGDYHAHWCINLTNADGSLIRINDHPQFWYTWNGIGGTGHSRVGPLAPDGPSGTGAARGTIADSTAEERAIPGNDPVYGYFYKDSPDRQHHGSFSYPAYILTGDRYYIDQAKRAANYLITVTTPVDTTKTGVLFGRKQGWTSGTDPYTVQYFGLLEDDSIMRGWAWSLRHVVDVSAYTPDADAADKAYFTMIAENNLEFLADYVISTGTADGSGWGISKLPLMHLQTAATTYMTSPMWQVAYMSMAVWKAKLNGIAVADCDVWLNVAPKCQIDLLNQTEFGPDYAMPYYPAGGKRTSGVLTWYATWSEYYIGNYTEGSPHAASGDYPNAHSWDNYKHEGHFLVGLGRAQGVSGAAAAKAIMDARGATSAGATWGRFYFDWDAYL